MDEWTSEPPADSALEDDEDDFAPEITTLRSGERSRWSLELWSARPLAGAPAWRGAHVRRYAAGLGTALLIVLVVALGGHGVVLPSLTPQHTSLKTQMALTNGAFIAEPEPERDGIGCLVHAAWSPDSQQYAILGYRQDCGFDVFKVGLLNLYDASGKLGRQVQLDSTITYLLHRSALAPVLAQQPSQFRGHTGPLLRYRSILWSPDGRRLAISFLAVTSAHPETDFFGLVVMDIAGSNATVLIEPDAQPEHDNVLVRWDLARGRAAQIAFLPERTQLDGNVTPALGYRWDEQDVLQPETPLSTDTSPVAPLMGAVGNPARDAHFTIWQTGELDMIDDGSGNLVAFAWQASFASWSPDGQAVVEAVTTGARLARDGRALGDATAQAQLQLDGTALLPVRDAALNAEVETMAHTAQEHPIRSMLLAWRPDGRVLATSRSAASATLFDCATGHVLASVGPILDAAPSGTIGAPLWSPDGTHLLLSNGAVLGPRQLGLPFRNLGTR